MRTKTVRKQRLTKDQKEEMEINKHLDKFIPALAMALRDLGYDKKFR